MPKSEPQPTLDTIVALAKRRGFIFQGSEIYGGLAGTWDYGPMGVQLKRNIMQLLWKMFVDARDDMVGVDASILMNQKVWQASGHVSTFTDPLVECSNCNARYREDHLHKEMQETMGMDASMTVMKCPNCGKAGTFGKPRQFNMMLKTNVGPVESEASISYLRPETAQGIFTNFRNVVDTLYPAVPFGIAQQGKAFRNEISPRDFIFRSREFEQMEIEYFVHPEHWKAAFEMWVELVHNWCDALGLPKNMVHELEVPKSDRAHYSQRTIDFEFDFPIGREELLGLAYRTDFDLRNIEQGTGKPDSMKYLPKDGSPAFVPHVIEPSFGVERAVMAVLSSAYTEEKVGEDTRVVLKLKPELAPVKIAVSPLLRNKPELVEMAQKVYRELKTHFGNVMYDDNGNIGKRYRRQDEIGTPLCVVIDFDSLTGHDVTVRHRDTMDQSRVKVAGLTEAITKQLANFE